MATDYNAKFKVNDAKTLTELETAVNALGAIAEKEQAMVGVLESVKKVWTDSSTAATDAATRLNANSADLTHSWNKKMSDASAFTTKIDGSTKSLTDGSEQMAGASGVTNKLQGLTDYIVGTGVQVANAKTEALRQIAFARSYGTNASRMEGATMGADDIANQYVKTIIPYVLPMGNALQFLGKIYEEYGPEITAQAQQLKWVGPGGNNASTGGPRPGGAPAGAPPGGAPSDAGADPGADDAAAPGGEEPGAEDPAAQDPGAQDPGAGGDPGQGDLPPLPGDPPGTGLAGLPPLAPPNTGLPTLPPLQSHPGPYPTSPTGGPPPLIPPTGPLGIGPGSKGKLPSLGGPGKGGGGLGGLGGGGLGKGLRNGLPDLAKVGDPALRGDPQIARAGQQVSAPAQPSTGQAPAAPNGLAGSPAGTPAGGAGGAPPPMMPPGAGAGGGGGRGGKPGAGAIRPVNRKRKSQEDETPGVPIGLRGKAGRSLPGGFPMVPASSRRRADEREKADTIELLDEELWKVEEAEAAETKKRIGRLAT